MIIPWKRRALERTLGVVLFQDQVNQLAIDVAGFAPSEADRLRRAFGRKHNDELIKQYRQKFLEGAKAGGSVKRRRKLSLRNSTGCICFPSPMPLPSASRPIRLPG